MHRRCGCRQVDPTVQLLPRGSAHSLDHGVVGGNRKRDQDRKGGHADGDVGTLQDVLYDSMGIETLIEEQVGGEMRAGVKKGKQP